MRRRQRNGGTDVIVGVLLILLYLLTHMRPN